MAASLLAFTAGCETADSKLQLQQQIDELKLETTELFRQVTQAESENQQLQQQLRTLAAVRSKDAALYNLQTVKVTRYTNLYDKDNDGKKEKLIVYLQPIDEDGDIIKATGAVDVQLWDLDKPAGQALLGTWHVKPDQLKKLWFATVVTTNYRLTFDVADIIEDSGRALTVKVTFTDYLSGKVFKEQKLIKP